MSKDIENKENEIEKEEKSFKRNFKMDRKKVILGLIIGLAILLIIGVVLFFTFHKQEEKFKENIELKYTETFEKKADGIYITDVSDIVEQVMPSIVSITSKTIISSGIFGPSFFGEERYQEGAGSGIIIGKNDANLMILTNNHVVDEASELSVQFINEKSYDAKVIGISERKDIAVIAVPIKNINTETLEAIKVATMGDSNQLKVGNGIIAIGNALGYGQSVTTGVVSALNREISVDGNSYKMIQIDAAINGGNSGGALLNSAGESWNKFC